MINGLVAELKRELKPPRRLAAATGEYAQLIAAKPPEILRIEPNLTLERLRLVWKASTAA